jgi:hypothetical protein
MFPADRFHGPSHEDEVLFRIGPVDPAAVEAYAELQAREGRNVVVEA